MDCDVHLGYDLGLEGYLLYRLLFPCFCFFDFISLLASWLLGFLVFRLLGFLASRLLSFSAFCWLMRLLVAFWLSLFASWLLHPFIGFWIWLPAS